MKKTKNKVGRPKNKVPKMPVLLTIEEPVVERLDKQFGNNRNKIIVEILEELSVFNIKDMEESMLEHLIKSSAVKTLIENKSKTDKSIGYLFSKFIILADDLGLKLAEKTNKMVETSINFDQPANDLLGELITLLIGLCSKCDTTFERAVLKAANQSGNTEIVEL